MVHWRPAATFENGNGGVGGVRLTTASAAALQPPPPSSFAVNHTTADDTMTSVDAAVSGGGVVRRTTAAAATVADLPTGKTPLGGASVVVDVNYNSPVHHSSVDGSFIQDETEMHLILDFDRDKDMTELLSSAPLCNNGGQQQQPAWNDHCYQPATTRRDFQPSSVLTASWIQKQQAQWATDFDANIAELDFDNGTTKQILCLPQNTFVLPQPPHQQRQTNSRQQQQRFWASIGEECLDELSGLAQPAGSSLPSLPMKGSLELSSGDSLFSSTADPAGETEEEEALKLLVEGGGGGGVGGGGAGISTDSLDLSTFDAEQLLVACETKKQDYMLTFQQMSVMGASSVTSKTEPPSASEALELDSVNLYRDAQLSKAGERFNQGRRSAAEQKTETKPENLTDSQKMTSWGHIKLSYDTSDFDPNEGSAKFYSSPNLVGCQSPGIPDAGEGMANAELLPIYDLTTSQHYQSCKESVGAAAAEPISLLRVFRNKLSINNDSCGLSSLDEDTSSGYVTGEKSDNATPRQPINIMHVDDGDTTQATDYEYAEYYIGNGRYIDINQNEIGYVPPSTDGIQSVQNGRRRQRHQEQPQQLSQEEQTPVATPRQEQSPTATEGSPRDRWTMLSPRCFNFFAPVKPPRTFATLLAHADGTAHQSHDTAADRLAHSSTQVPNYVSDRGVQTTLDNNQRLITTVVTSPTDAEQNCDKLIYAQRQPRATTQPSLAKVSRSDVGSEVPDLGFLQMPFQIPPLFPSCAPFPLEFLTNKNADASLGETELTTSNETLCGGANKPRIASSKTTPLFANQAPPPSFQTLTGNQMFNNLDINRKTSLLNGHLPLFPPFTNQLHETTVAAHSSQQQQQQPPQLLQTPPPVASRTLSAGSTAAGPSRERDSGLGSSGPSNINDWESLATLLPKEVVHACSFFKTNSHFLGKSGAQGGGGLSPREYADGNSIEKPGRRSNRQCRFRPQSYDPTFTRLHRWNQIESIREEDTGCAAFESQCHHQHRRPQQYHSCHDGYGSAQTRCRRHQRGASAVHYRHRTCHQVVHCCGYEVAASQPPLHCCSSSSVPLRRHPTWNGVDDDACSCCSVGCSSDDRLGDNRKPSGGGTNLKRWRYQDGVMTDSETDCSGVDHPPPPVALKRRALAVRPMRLTSSTLSSRSDEDRVDEEDDEQMTMASEYQLRQRDSRVDDKQFRSLHNVTGSASSASQNDEEVRACATCYRVRSPTTDGAPPLWAQPPAVRPLICDCETADVLDEIGRRGAGTRCWLKLRPGQVHPEEVAVRGTPVYQEKKKLVDNLVNCCARLASRFPVDYSPEQSGEKVRLMVRDSLCPAVEALVADGLLEHVQIWSVIKASAKLGASTTPIHDLVCELTANSGAVCEGEKDTSQFYAFVYGLLEKRLLDCWLSYTALKDSLLAASYAESAFLRRSAGAYRSLFDRLIAAIRPLSLLAFDRLPTSAEHVPTRLPSDSRVPKSSSIPARLSASPAAAGRRRRQGSVDAALPGGARARQPTTSSPSRRPMSRSRIPVLRTSTTSSNAGVDAATTPTSVSTPSGVKEATGRPALRYARSASEHKSKIARPMSKGRKP